MSHHERLCTSVLSEQRRKRKAVCSQITHETERCLFLTVRSTTMRPWEEKPSSKKNCDSRRWCSLQVPCLFATQNVTGRQRYNWKRRMRGKLYWRGRESDRKQRLKLRENRNYYGLSILLLNRKGAILPSFTIQHEVITGIITQKLTLQ